MNRRTIVCLYSVLLPLGGCDFLTEEESPPRVLVFPEEAVLAVGDMLPLEVRVFGRRGEIPGAAVTWSSSNASVARVVSDAVVTAFGPGETEIKAFSQNVPVEAYGSVTVTVYRQFWWLVTGGAHTCALAPMGRAYCWGDNAYGQLGTGTTTSSAVPAAVAGGLVWGGVRTAGSLPRGPSRRIAAGDYHTCAVTTDPIYASPVPGGIYCWGRGTRGQLGDGARVDRATPVAVVGGRRFESLTAGNEHTCGIEWFGGTDPNAAFCWGFNGDGALGDRSTTDRDEPTPVAGGLLFVMLAASRHTCGITTDGVAYCWGPNESGQLGNGTTEPSLVPVPVAGGHRFTVLDTGDRHTCAATEVAELYCWGLNASGELGDGSTDMATEPVLVAGGLPVREGGGAHFAAASVAASAGAGPGDGNHSCAIASHGPFAPFTLASYCWGANASGQLGVGTTTPSRVPALVSFPESDVRSLYAGGAHTCALTMSGEAFCWGANGSGQLGDGTTTGSAVPVRVTDPS